MAACKGLKEAGYLIALDDFVRDDPREPLTQMADIVKVDMKLTTPVQRVDLIKRFGPWRWRLLAETVETRQEFVAAGSRASSIFRDISSAGRKCWPPTACPGIASTT
jgi:c-di-GMP-related signal transduction protein